MTPLQAQTIFNPNPVPAAVLSMPVYRPPIIQGITLYPQDPFKFDFIIDQGDERLKEEQLRKESMRLIKYFLASLTVPEKDMWVNLNPAEKNRIVPKAFGQTEMGRDMLAQDYLLKQLTASLLNPDNAIGGKVWEKLRHQMKNKLGKSDIPVDIFNKVWIVPQKAVVYVHENHVFVVESRLKVMLEEDYWAMSSESKAQSGQPIVSSQKPNTEQLQIMREVLVPALEYEVNEGKNFSSLRQIFNSLILACWYKENLKQSILAQNYVNRNLTEGVNTDDPNAPRKIYDEYLQSFKQGVYDFIKEDYNSETQVVVSRKYFSGGVSAADTAMLTQQVGDQQLDAGQRALLLQREKTALTVILKAPDALDEGRDPFALPDYKMEPSDVRKHVISVEQFLREAQDLAKGDSLISGSIGELLRFVQRDLLKGDINSMNLRLANERLNKLIPQIPFNDGRISTYDEIKNFLSKAEAALTQALDIQNRAINAAFHVDKAMLGERKRFHRDFWEASRSVKAQEVSSGVLKDGKPQTVKMKIFYDPDNRLGYEAAFGFNSADGFIVVLNNSHIPPEQQKVIEEEAIFEEATKAVLRDHQLRDEEANMIAQVLSWEKFSKGSELTALDQYRLDHMVYEELNDAVKYYESWDLKEKEASMERDAADAGISIDQMNYKKYQRKFFQKIREKLETMEPNVVLDFPSTKAIFEYLLTRQQLVSSKEITVNLSTGDKVFPHKSVLAVLNYALNELGILYRPEGVGNIALFQLTPEARELAKEIRPYLRAWDVKRKTPKTREIMEKTERHIKNALKKKMLVKERAKLTRGLTDEGRKRIEAALSFGEHPQHRYHEEKTFRILAQEFELEGQMAEIGPWNNYAAVDGILAGSQGKVFRANLIDRGYEFHQSQSTVDDRITHLWGDGRDLVPVLHAESQDIIVYNESLAHMTGFDQGTSYEKALKEAWKVLKPGGKLIINGAFLDKKGAAAEKIGLRREGFSKTLEEVGFKNIEIFQGQVKGYESKVDENYRKIIVATKSLDSAMLAKLKYDFSDEPWFIKMHLSKFFHDIDHSKRVANLASLLAMARKDVHGITDRQANFLFEVGLLHDLDNEETRAENTSPRVPSTLRILEDDWQGRKFLDKEFGKSFLREKLGWSEEEYLTARVIIARSEYPMAEWGDEDFKLITNPEYNEQKTPFGEYKKEVERLISFLKSNEKDAEYIRQSLIIAIREAFIFSEYADKASGQMERDYEATIQKVEELAQEKGFEVAKFVGDNFKNFVSKLGQPQSFIKDQKVVDELVAQNILQRGDIKFLTMDEILEIMSKKMPREAINFKASWEGAKRMGEVYADGKGDYGSSKAAGIVTARQELARQSGDRAMLANDVTWEQMMARGYEAKIERDGPKDSVPRVYLISVYKDGELISDGKTNSSIRLVVYPQQKIVHIGNFFPSFPKPLTEEQKIGAGRVLLRHLIEVLDLRRYKFIIRAEPPFEKSLLKMTDLKPAGELNKPLELQDRRVKMRDTIWASQHTSGLSFSQLRELDVSIMLSNVSLEGPDAALLTVQHSAPEAPGGIDFNPARFKVEEKGEKVKFNVPAGDPAMLNQPAIRGYVPVIINIQPVTNLPFLLGISTKSPQKPSGGETAEASKKLSFLEAKKEEKLSF